MEREITINYIQSGNSIEFNCQHGNKNMNFGEYQCNNSFPLPLLNAVSVSLTTGAQDVQIPITSGLNIVFKCYLPNQTPENGGVPVDGDGVTIVFGQDVQGDTLEDRNLFVKNAIQQKWGIY